MTGSNPLHFFCAIKLHFLKKNAEPANAGSALLQSFANDRADHA